MLIDFQMVAYSSAPVETQNAAPAGSTGVTKDLSRLLEGANGADVEFIVGSEILSAHRNILSARSPVFAALL